MATIEQQIQQLKARGVPEEFIYQKLREKGMGVQPTASAPASKPSGNFVTRLITAPIDAARRFGEYAGEAVYQGGRFAFDPVFRKSVMGKDLTEEEARKLSEQPSTRFLKEEDVRNRGEIVKQGVKRTADAASYAVPIGGSAGRIILGGAASGALQGVAQGDEIDPGNITAGATGGAIGAGILGVGVPKVLGAVGKGLGKLGRSAQDDLVNPQVQAGPYGAREEQALLEGAKTLGLKGSASQQYKQLPTLMDDLSGQIKTTLSKNKKTVNTSKVVADLTKALDDNINFVGDDIQIKARDKYFNQLTNVANKRGKNGLKLTAEDLFQAKQNLGKQLKPAFTKLEKGNPLTQQEEVGMSIWRALDDVITQNAPEVKELTSKQALLFDLAPGLKKKSMEKVTIPVLGNQVSATPLQAAQSMVGRGAQSVPSLPGAPAGAFIGRSVGAAATEQEPTVNPESEGIVSDAMAAEEPLLSPQGQWRWDATANDWIPNDQQAPDMLSQIDQTIMQDFQATGGKNFEKLSKYAEYIQSKTAGTDPAFQDLTDKQRSFVGAGQIAGEVLDILSTSPGSLSIGPVAGRVSGLQTITGTEAPEMTALKSKIATARTIARNAMLGANMSDKEIESYLDATFNINLPSNVLAERLKSFVGDMQTLAYGQQSAVPAAPALMFGGQ